MGDVVELPFVAVQSQDFPQPPIGAIEAISKGFEAVTNRLGLILFPIILDLILWLGPRLSIERLVKELMGFVVPPAGADAITLQNVESLRQVSEAITKTYNLFSLLSTTPLGLPSLMVGRMPAANPLGVGHALQVGDPLVYLSVMVALQLAGLLLGAAYLGLIAQQSWEASVDLPRLSGHLIGLWGRLLVLAIVTSPVVVAVRWMLLAISASPNSGILPILGLTVAAWLLTYLAFSFHGLVAGRGVFQSIVDSLRLVQWNLSSTVMLLVTVLLLNWGLGMVWNIPKDDSWLTFIGIAGHGYITTALFAGTFVFYRDRHRWVNEIRAHWARQALKQPSRGEGGRQRMR